MKTKEFIEKLQELDPEGICDLNLGGDVKYIDRLPWYYDGRAQIFIKDESGKVIGIRQATKDDPDKIVVYLEDVSDFGWDAGYDGKEFIIEGDEHFKSRFERARLDAIKCCEKIEEEERCEKIIKEERSNIGVLVYYDEYHDSANMQFYWGGYDYTDPSILDIYHQRDKIIESCFENDEEKYEMFLDDAIFSLPDLREEMENDYTFGKSVAETESILKHVHSGWKWIDVIPDAYKD